MYYLRARSSREGRVIVVNAVLLLLASIPAFVGSSGSSSRKQPILGVDTFLPFPPVVLFTNALSNLPVTRNPSLFDCCVGGTGLVPTAVNSDGPNQRLNSFIVLLVLV